MDKHLLEDFEQEIPQLSDAELFVKIWTEPTKTFEHILHHCPEKYVLGLMALGGITRALDNAMEKGRGDEMSNIAIIGMAIVAGILAGWLSYYFYAWLLGIAGKWLNGETPPSTFRTILAWASVPTINSLLLIVPGWFIFGEEMFKSEPMFDTWSQELAFLGFIFIHVILGIWSLVILVKGIKLVQGFSTGKSILNIFLAGVIFIIPVFVLAFLLLSVLN